MNEPRKKMVKVPLSSFSDFIVRNGLGFFYKDGENAIEVWSLNHPKPNARVFSLTENGYACLKYWFQELSTNQPCNYMKMMGEFHRGFSVPIGKCPHLLMAKDNVRRLSLIMSEVGELCDATREQNLIEVADALGDLLYVTFGMAVEMGLPMDRIFREIHESNMSKVTTDGKVIKDAGGKVIKPDNYKPVDLSWLMAEQEDDFDDDDD